MTKRDQTDCQPQLKGIGTVTFKLCLTRGTEKDKTKKKEVEERKRKRKKRGDRRRRRRRSCKYKSTTYIRSKNPQACEVHKSDLRV